MKFKPRIFNEKHIALLFLVFFWYYGLVWLVMGISERGSDAKSLGSGYFFLCFLAITLGVSLRRIVFKLGSSPFPMTWTCVFLFYAIPFSLSLVFTSKKTWSELPGDLVYYWSKSVESIQNFSFHNFDVHGFNLLFETSRFLIFIWWPLATLLSAFMAVLAWRQWAKVN
jgi:hypothetical protein